MNRQEPGSADLGYEIRDVRGERGDSDRIEAWLPGWLWWTVQAVKRDDGWLVLVDRAVAETAGVPNAARTALEAADAEQARIWVELLAALYVKAAA
jgi:hypothetical protein